MKIIQKRWTTKEGGTKKRWEQKVKGEMERKRKTEMGPKPKTKQKIQVEERSHYREYR